MKKKRSNLRCYFCDALIAGSNEVDHFPIAERHGGKLTVPICLSCHDMKDRFCLKDWPDSWRDTFIKEFPKLSRETKLYLAKSINIINEILNKDRST